jgi:UPF0716 protein FxsA
MFAGVLLLIPGVISDVIAVILLLIPANNPGLGQAGQKNSAQYRASANDEVIEGEFTEVEEAKPADNVVHLPRKD